MGSKSSRLKGPNNRSDGHPLSYARSTFLRGGGSNSAKRASDYIGLTATGGNTVTTVGSYKTHIFTSPGTFSVDPAAPTGDFGATIEYLVIAGGGGGQSTYHGGTACPGGSGQTMRGGGGGGAGGVRTNSPTFDPVVSSGAAYSVSSGSSYAVTVGAGGANDARGGDSVFNTGGVEGTTKFTATGGGTGSQSGGSGGGGAGGCQPGGAGNSPPTSPPQGTPGIQGYGPPGQGFSGAPGGSILPTGGVTSSSFNGSSTVYARGGDGGGYSTPGTGGGAYGNAPGQAGAPGVVIVRYKILP